MIIKYQSIQNSVWVIHDVENKPPNNNFSAYVCNISDDSPFYIQIYSRKLYVRFPLQSAKANQIKNGILCKVPTFGTIHRIDFSKAQQPNETPKLII